MARPLYIGNFVDLDPSDGILDWDCSQYIYNGHNGIDIGIRSFAEQEIGVPVWAALDGVVAQTHDGETDMNTVAMGQTGIYVSLDHGNGQRTDYHHLKKGGVAVSVGQVVKAGTQLGLVGSSGNSTGPHLHLTPLFNNFLYEPTAGYCRSGASNWKRQPAIRRDVFINDFAMYDTAYSGNLGFDPIPRTGAFVTGLPRTMYFRIDANNLPARSSYRFRFFRPDGNQSLTFGDNLNNDAYLEDVVYYFGVNVNMAVTGVWRVVFEFNDRPVVDAPYEVVANANQITNRAPFPVNVTFDPPAPAPNDVIFCRVLTPLVRRDPDYDIVRYRYQWRVNGNIARELTSAALTDAIPKGAAKLGDLVECTVTPSDGRLSGASATTSIRIGAATRASVSAATFLKEALSGDSIIAAFGGALAPTTQAASTIPLPTEMAGTRETVRDRAGVARFAPLFYVSPAQVNYLMPVETATGTATVTISHAGGSSSETTQIVPVAPGLFTADASGRGLPAGFALRVRGDGSRSMEPLVVFDPAQNRFVANPVDLGPPSDQLFLILFGAGIRSRTAITAVTARMAGVDLPVSYAGPQGEFVGLDQLNIGLPRGLGGKGEADLTLVVDGVAANLVRVCVK
ncbi:MAG: peptidoglycan DD-metalloendopeptidase family protein [Acidobacteria bacterium]|nr:peptidoglycan DD-metalloendopeptidase family protein [Acidobacteriota bacterium]